MSLQVRKTQLDCLEFTYKSSRKDGSITESSILLDYTESSELLTALTDSGPDAFKRAIYDYFHKKIESYNEDDSHHVEILSLVSNDTFLHSLLPANKGQGMFKNIYVDGQPLNINVLAAKHETISIQDLVDMTKSLKANNAQSNLLQFLAERAKETALYKTKNLSVVLTDGFLSKDGANTVKIIGSDYINTTFEDQNSGLYFNKGKNNPVIFARTRSYFNQNQELNEDVIRILNHELLHFLFDNSLNTKEVNEELTKLRTAIYNLNHPDISKTEIKNNDEFLAYYLTSSAIRNNAGPEIVASMNDLIMNILTTPFDPNSEAEITEIQKIAPEIIKSLSNMKFGDVHKGDVKYVKPETTEETDELPSESDDNLPFMETNNSFFTDAVEELSFKKKDQQESARELYRRFRVSTREWVNPKTDKVTRDYSISYGEYMEIGDKSKDMGPYRQLFNLKQGDLVYYKFTPKGEKTEMRIPRPVLFSFLNKEGRMIFALAANDSKEKGNVQYAEIDEIVAYRKNYGVPADGFDSTSKGELKRIHKAFEDTKLLDKDGNLIVDKESSVFYTFKSSYEDEKGSTIEYNKVRPKNSSTIYVSFNTNDNFDRIHFSSLKEGDLVKGSFKLKEGSYRDYYAPVVRVMGETVETVIKVPVQTEKGVVDTYVSKFIPKSDLKGALLLKDNHEEDLMEQAINKLRTVAKTGSFFKNNKFALKKMTFVKYNQDGSRNTEKPSWNDIDYTYSEIQKYGGNWEKYRNWRIKLGEDALAELKATDIKNNLEVLYFYMYKALDRRKHLASKLKFGDLIQVDRPKMKSVNDEWVPVEGEVTHAPALVVSQNGDWLNVLVYKQTFGLNSDTDESGGSKIKVTGDDVYFKKVRINQGVAEAKLVKDKSGNPILKNGKKQFSQVLSIRAVYFDNTEYKALIDNFEEIKKEFGENFNYKKEYFETLKAKKPLPEHLKKFSLPVATSRTEGDNEYDFRYDKLGTKIADKYDIEFFKEDMTEDEKMRALMTLRPGNIVFKEGTTYKNKENKDVKVPYTTMIILDKDPKTGKLLVGYKQKKFDQYTVIPIDESVIIGFGTNTSDDTLVIPANEELNEEAKVMIIPADKSRKDRMKRIIDSFKSFKASLYFDSEKEALNWVKENKAKLWEKQKDKIFATPIYESSNGEKSLTKPKGDYKTIYTPEIKRYSEKKDKYYNERIKDSDYWTSLYMKSLDKANKKTLWDFIEKGDILTRTYEDKDGRTKYVDSIVIGKTGETMTVRSMHPVFKDDSWSYKDHYVFNYSNSTFDDLHAIHLHKSNHDYLDVDKYYKSLNNQEVLKRERVPFYMKHRVNGSKSSSTSRRSKEKAIVPTAPKREQTTEKPKTSSIFKMDFKFSKSLDFKSKPVEMQKVKAFGDRLQSMYNVEIRYLDSQTISEMPSGNLKAKHRAFVDIDGTIVINTDFASLAEPIHELGHLAMLGLKSTNLELYRATIAKMKSHDLYDTIKTNYPELSDEEIGEETFLTVSSEHFNNRNPNIKDINFVDSNPNLFKRVFKAIKDWVAKFMGINDRSFFDLDPEDVMRLSFGNLFDRYNTAILNGSFTKQIDIAKLNQEMKFNGKYAKDSDLYKQLLKADVSEENAREIWVATHTENFAKWGAKPDLKYRINIDTVVDDFVEGSDPVFVKGDLIQNTDGSYQISNTNQVMSIFSIFTNPVKTDYSNTIEDYSINNQVAMLGDYDLLSKNAKLLKEKFKDLDFYVEPAGSSYVISYHNQPSSKVSQLKDLLYKNNLLKMLC